MPKESLDIGQYRGMVGSADAHDLPLGAAVYAENLDTVQQQGLFTPLPLDTVIAPTIGKCDQVTHFDDGTIAALVDRTTSDTIRIVTTSNMTAVTPRSGGAATKAVTRTDWDTIASDGESVRIGLGAAEASAPQWAGTIFHQQFGAGNTGIDILDAELKRAESVGVWADETLVKMYLPAVLLDGTKKTWEAGTVNFNNGRSYVWMASVVYDGHQEGPLAVIAKIYVSTGDLTLFGTGPGATQSNAYNTQSGVLQNHGGGAASYTWQNAVSEFPSNNNDVPATGLSRIEFPVRVRVASTPANPLLPARITGINIYRSSVDGYWISAAEALPGTDRFTIALPEPEHLGFIDINDPDWSSAAVGTHATEDYGLSSETYRTFTFTDDYPGSDETFQSRTGYPATLEHMQIHYGVSCTAESYHVVGRCWNPDLKEIESWLFRSKPYRYDTFDWTNDYLVLPSEPNALVYWSGRLYAFCDGRTYLINPGTFDVEDTWEGIGALHRKSIVVTDRGMFWADNSNIYWHDGSRVQMIGTPVLRNQYGTDGLDAAWLDSREEDDSAPPVVVYDARYDSVIVCYTTTSGAAGALSYHVEAGTWTFVTFAGVAGPFHTGFQSPTGVAHVSMDATAAPKFYSLFTSASKRTWKWVSPQILSMGGKARYYLARIGTKVGIPSAANIKLYDNDPTYAAAHAVSSLSADIGSVQDAELTISPGVWITMREFAMEITGTAAQDVTHMSIIRRTMTPR